MMHPMVAAMIRRNTSTTLYEDAQGIRVLQAPEGGMVGALVAAMVLVALLCVVAAVLAMSRPAAVLLVMIGLVPLLAVAGLLAMIPRREVVIGDGLVRAGGRGGWSEPLSAYVGLHAWVDRWQVVPADRQVEDITGRVTLVRGKDEAQRYQVGVLTLVHRQDGRRSIDLIRQPTGAIKTAVAQTLAQRLGVTLRWTH